MTPPAAACRITRQLSELHNRKDTLKASIEAKQAEIAELRGHDATLAKFTGPESPSKKVAP